MQTTYEDGASAYNRGEYVTAKRLWLPLAEAGDPTAQTMLGIIYEEGEGVPHDYAAAMNRYRRAEDQGESDAQFSINGA
jgi:TPR repeat protein